MGRRRCARCCRNGWQGIRGTPPPGSRPGTHDGAADHRSGWLNWSPSWRPYLAGVGIRRSVSGRPASTSLTISSAPTVTRALPAGTSSTRAPAPRPSRRLPSAPTTASTSTPMVSPRATTPTGGGWSSGRLAGRQSPRPRSDQQPKRGIPDVGVPTPTVPAQLDKPRPDPLGRRLDRDGHRCRPLALGDQLGARIRPRDFLIACAPPR
jgi:hypothetical protein